MIVGALYPAIELAGSATAVREVGAACEDLGVDHLTTYEHVLGASREGRELGGPYDHRDPFHDPFVMFAYLAGRTSRLQFATGVVVAPQRQTALLAKQVADLAVLSDGRLRLGVGVGWNAVEFEALGQDFYTRGARLDEQIPLLRRLLSEPVVSFQGRFDRVDRAGVLPLPELPVPIWVGGHRTPALRRGALLGDGFFFSTAGEHALRGWSRLREHLAEVGRPVEGFGADVIVTASSDVPVAVDRVQEWASAGGTHVTISTQGNGFTTAAEHVGLLERVLIALR